MKKLVAIIISCIALAIGSSSCEDMMGNYLDKAPGIDVTEDTVFSSTAHAERFLATVYRYAVHSNLPYFTEGWADPTNYDGTLSSGASDE